VSPELMEEIMVGGKEGAAKLQQVLVQTAASAELAARKSILANLAPAYEAVVKQVQGLVVQQQRAQQEQVEARFFGSPERADYRQHADLCRRAAEHLAQQYPNEVSQMSEDEFFGEITKQVDYNLTRQAQALFGQGVTDWRQLRQQFGGGTPAAAPAPAAPAPAPASLRQPLLLLPLAEFAPGAYTASRAEFRDERFPGSGPGYTAERYTLGPASGD
jgi:hypothetical protein